MTPTAEAAMVPSLWHRLAVWIMRWYDEPAAIQRTERSLSVGRRALAARASVASLQADYRRVDGRFHR